MKENRCFFQVSCIRCHIVRIQGDWRKICQICVQLNKQTNKGEKIWNFCFGVISFEYRGRKKKKKSRENRWKIANFDNFMTYSCVLCSKSCVLKSRNEKWSDNTPHQSGKIWNLRKSRQENRCFFSGFLNSVSYRSNTERYARYVSSLTNKQFEIWANPSQMLPTFCHDNKVKKPWKKFQKKVTKISFVSLEKGFEREIKAITEDKSRQIAP